MKPTAIRQITASVLPPLAEPPSTTTLSVAPRVSTGTIVLTEDQAAAAEQMLAQFNFMTMPPAEIIQIGLPAEQGLQTTLNGFLSRLNTQSSGKVFALFDRLGKGVSDADLPEVVKKIQNDKPGWFALLVGRIKGKKPDEVARDAYDKVKAIVSGRTRTLADVLNGLETELADEMKNLLEELQALEDLKTSYHGHVGTFAIAAGAAQAMLAKARADVEKKEADVNEKPSATAQTLLQELKNKLQLLESRALALEGTYTRLPADQLVTQEIEQAGIATLQETATTASSRFANIKMTVLRIHGSFAVKGVQQLNQKQAQLDAQLAEVGRSLAKDIVTTSANAPGENRLAQVKQIEQIITDTVALNHIIAQARKDNEAKFKIAREKFAAARDSLSKLS